MTERDPSTLPGLDPEQFVGEPPAGDSDPSGFLSDDQSQDRTAEADPEPDEPDQRPEDDR